MSSRVCLSTDRRDPFKDVDAMMEGKDLPRATSEFEAWVRWEVSREASTGSDYLLDFLLDWPSGRWTQSARFRIGRRPWTSFYCGPHEVQLVHLSTSGLWVTNLLFSLWKHGTLVKHKPARFFSFVLVINHKYWMITRKYRADGERRETDQFDWSLWYTHDMDLSVWFMSWNV